MMKWPELSGSLSRTRLQDRYIFWFIYLICILWYFSNLFFFLLKCFCSWLPHLWSWISSTSTLVFLTVMLPMTKLLLKVLKPLRSMFVGLYHSKPHFFFLLTNICCVCNVVFRYNVAIKCATITPGMFW